MFNLKAIATVLAFSFAAVPVANAAEPVCTASLLTEHMDYTGDPGSVDRVSRREHLSGLPEGTPTCMFVGFKNDEWPASEALAHQTAAAALHYVCDDPRRVRAISAGYIVEGSCRFEDGTVVRWRGQPLPPARTHE